MDKAAIMKEHQQAPAAPCNLHAVGKQHLGGRCRWCKQDGKVQEKKKYNINGGTDRRTSKFKKVWRVHHMECKRYSLKRGNIDRTKKYMNRNNPSIICVFCFCIDFQRIKSEMSCLSDTKRWIHGFPLFQGSRVHSHQDRQIGWNPASPASNISPLNIKPHDAINQSPGLRKDQTSPHQDEQPNTS